MGEVHGESPRCRGNGRVFRLVVRRAWQRGLRNVQATRRKRPRQTTRRGRL